MLYFQFVIVAAVFGGIAWVAAGRGGGIVDAAPDRPDVALPDDRQLAKADIDAARFTVGWRGYRMDEVDKVLDRLAAEIDYRDRLISELTGSGLTVYGPGGYEPTPTAYEPVARGDEAGDAAAGTSQGAATQSAATPRPAAGHGAEDADRTDPAETGDGYDDNPLSAWYRRPEPPA